MVIIMQEDVDKKKKSEKKIIDLKAKSLDIIKNYGICCPQKTRITNSLENYNSK